MRRRILAAALALVLLSGCADSDDPPAAAPAPPTCDPTIERSFDASGQVKLEITEDDASIAVTDHRAGIPSDDQAHIFERFWQSPADGPGVGLGLPIARQIALAHGGDLTVISPGPAGDGSVFQLRLRR